MPTQVIRKMEGVNPNMILRFLPMYTKGGSIEECLPRKCTKGD